MATTAVTDPDITEALRLYRLGRLAEAEASAQQVVAACALQVNQRPGAFEPLANLGLILAQLGRYAEAELVLNAALELRPDHEPVLSTLGAVLLATRRAAEAEKFTARAVAADPGMPDAWINHGAVLEARRRLDEAALAYDRALALAPGSVLAEFNRSLVLLRQWRNTEGLAGLCRVLELAPDYAPAWHASLFQRLHEPDESEETLFEAHGRWGRLVPADAAPAEAPTRRSPVAGRRLRVGYVSPDFKRHSCAHFLRPLLAAHDRSLVEVFAYSATGRTDDFTDWFRARADHWRDIRGQSDAAVAGMIRRDGIDVLVDLAGHTRDQPLAVFARQPAPVQVAWLGYPATTGLPQIHYRFTDRYADPPGESDRWHTERLVRLPGSFLCYEPPEDAPPVAPPPRDSAQVLTFGSFNSLAKVTPVVVETWSRVLRAVPGSRLLLKNQQLEDASARRRVIAAFTAAGVDASRLELLGWVRRRGHHLSLYGAVDIALDTFPFNGATTTFDALWMGVPVVTLRGQRHAGRVGAAILTPLGRGEWIGDDPDDYVEIARHLAADPSVLAAERGRLRADLARSPLMDAAGFARQVEAAFVTMVADGGA